MNCDYTTYQEIAATDHSWNTDFTIDQPATCTEAGSSSPTAGMVKRDGDSGHRPQLWRMADRDRPDLRWKRCATSCARRKKTGKSVP